ncbi:hypothetical protein pb186bvf_013586 [Paramecium bursaria]
MKQQIQNINRKPSTSYLKPERFPTDPSPVNKENISKPSFLKSTLQNHLIKNQDRLTSPTPLNKTSIVNIFLKQKSECQIHKKRFKYEVHQQSMCTRCAIEYAIQSGIPFKSLEPERKMLTFGQEDDHDAFQQFASITNKELQHLNSINTQGDGTIKKKELRDFIIRVGDVISQNLQLLKLIQENTPTKHQYHKLQDEVLYVTKNILQELIEKQHVSGNSQTIQKQQNIQAIKQTLIQQVQDLQTIKKDIVENIENIITQMDVAPFKIIINKYNDKIKHVDDAVQQLQSQISFNQTDQTELTSQFKKVKETQFRRRLNKVLQELFDESSLKQSSILEQLVNGNTKFLQLLQKVNSNQNNNSMFYQSLLKDINQEENKPKIYKSRHKLD